MRICFPSVALAVAMIFSCLISLAADTAPAPAPLAYKPADLVEQHPLRVDITEVLLADATTGMTGFATGQVKLTTQTVTTEGNAVTLKVELLKVRQRMTGQTLASPLPKPVLLSLDGYARLTDPPRQEAPAAGEIISQGGLPVQAVAVICAVPQLSDHPAAPGDTWARTATYTFPGLGQATLAISTTLVSLQDGVATLNSHLLMKVPDFQADNPVLPGQKVKVHNLVVEVIDLVQQYDTAASVVRQSSGQLKASLEATAPDITLPIKLTATVTYSPSAP